MIPVDERPARLRAVWRAWDAAREAEREVYRRFELTARATVLVLLGAFGAAVAALWIAAALFGAGVIAALVFAWRQFGAWEAARAGTRARYRDLIDTIDGR